MADPSADAVVVAAGSSVRMGGVDKLDVDLLGRPLLRWSVEAVASARSIDRVVIVTRADRVESLAAQPWLREVAGERASVIAGGPHRSQSVRAGLAATRAPVVLVHDGARPLCSPTLVDAVAAAAAEHGAAVPVVPIVDSVKRVEGEALAGTVERDGLVRAQTPQGALRDVLMRCFETAGEASFSDEAALLQSQGVPVAIVPGEPSNVKVTDQNDIEVVRAIAAVSSSKAADEPAAAGRREAREPGAVRFGFGQDSHGFGPDVGLRLGGIDFPAAPRLYGHSDGDVVLHALATAVLSAAGLGDLGRHFPAGDAATKGVASVVLISQACRQAELSGWYPARVQVHLVGARPRLGAIRLDAMRTRIAELTGLAEDDVALSASSGNLNGAEGAGRVISATALVVVVRR